MQLDDGASGARYGVDWDASLAGKIGDDRLTPLLPRFR